MSQTGINRDPIHVGLGIVIDGGKVLISQRKREAILGGLWEFPGGKMEKGETVSSCIIRELQEELGIEVIPMNALETIIEDYEHASVHLHPMICKPAGGEASAIGVAQFRWVDFIELSNYPFPRANRLLISILQQMGLR